MVTGTGPRRQQATSYKSPLTSPVITSYKWRLETPTNQIFPNQQSVTPLSRPKTPNLKLVKPPKVNILVIKGRFICNVLLRRCKALRENWNILSRRGVFTYIRSGISIDRNKVNLISHGLCSLHVLNQFNFSD